MPRESGTKQERINFPYWEGVNSTVQQTIARRSELAHVENARAPIIGVLEKRQGQAKVGTGPNGEVFYTEANYGLAKLPLESTSAQGVFRLSATHTFSNTLSISVHDYVNVIDVQGVTTNTDLYIKVGDTVIVSEPNFFVRSDNGNGVIDGTSVAASIYSLSNLNIWTILADTSAQNIIGANADFAIVDGSLVVVNGKDYNRMISSDGTTVIDSTEAGSLFNSPRSKKVVSYKSRIYLANFIRNAVQYKTTILRSSFPLGIIALVNGDVAASATITVTDTKYFYTDSGMNSYDVYRGGTKIETITVTTINEKSIVASGAVTLLSSDEIWIAGTFTGAKQYRWVNNPTSIGKDVKQYDTFKLSGGEEDEITLFDTIGNILLIGNKNTLMTWNDFTLENFDTGIGCCSKNGYVKLKGSLYFLHYSGIYSTTGAAPVLISRKIERYIKGATKEGLESAASGFKGLSIFFSIGNVTLYNPDGSLWKVLSDVCLEYNTADQNWYVHINVPGNMFLNFINSSGTEQLLMGHTETGNPIKEFLIGTTDDGKEIFFRADTQQIQLNPQFETFSSPIAIVTRLQRGTLAKCFVALDDDDFYEIQGTVTKGVSILKIHSKDTKSIVTPPLAREIRISWRDSSKQLCRLIQSAIIFIPGTMDYSE